MDSGNKNNVLFITSFSEISGSSRVIVFQFLPFLKKAGITYKVRTIYPDNFFKIQMGIKPAGKFKKRANLVFHLFLSLIKRFYYAIDAGNYEVVFIQKDTFPKLIYWLLRRFNPNVIYEFEESFDHINPFLKRGFLSGLMLHYQLGLLKNMVKKAKSVIAVNDYVAEAARKFNDRVTVICEPINTENLKPARPEKRNIITLGWIGSPSTASNFLKVIESVLPELYKKHSNIQLKLIGAGNFSFSGIPLIKKDWRPNEELSDLQSFNIGLMPLDDGPFSKGHLGHKMIQYMCVGIPIVASNTGLNPLVVKDGVNGFLASSKEEWVEKLSLLIENEDLRRQLGRNGREMAEESFSLEKLSKVFINAIEEAKQPI